MAADDLSGFSLRIGQRITTASAQISEVVGIDCYVLHNILGEQLNWVSYTLNSGRAIPYDRWWLVCLPDRIPYQFIKSNKLTLGGRQCLELSGLVSISSTGDAALSEAIGSLHMNEVNGHDFHCVEIYQNCSALRLTGSPVTFEVLPWN